MANQRRPKNHKENSKNVCSGTPRPSDPDLADQVNLNSSPNTDPPSSLTPIVWDRLNSSLQKRSSTDDSNHQKQILAELGHQLRQWRIKEGYTRQELAEKLRLAVDQLLCIENGIGVPADISAVQLYALISLLTNDEYDRRLNASIQYYLALGKL